MQLEHQVGRFSDASLYALAEPGVRRAEVEVFGPGGAATVDCTRVDTAEALGILYREFAEAVSLHLQHVVESAETQLLTGA